MLVCSITTIIWSLVDFFPIRIGVVSTRLRADFCWPLSYAYIFFALDFFLSSAFCLLLSVAFCLSRAAFAGRTRVLLAPANVMAHRHARAQM